MWTGKEPNRALLVAALLKVYKGEDLSKVKGLEQRLLSGAENNAVNDDS